MFTLNVQIVIIRAVRECDGRCNNGKRRHMASDKRLQRRSTLNLRCWIFVGANVADAECRIVDISDTGAKITVPDGLSLDGELMLFLTQDGAVSRTCDVVWRKDCEVGLRFTHRPTQRSRGM